MNKFATEQFKNRLGYYLVNGQKFFNKTQALLQGFKIGQPITWVFNDDVYGNINWAEPININLTELYRQRAEQLRRDYDYLALYFSGGADSTNILHAFIDNNIFLDEIVMQVPKPFESTANGQDRSQANFYSEVEYSAVPILNKYRSRLHPQTQVRYQDINQPLIDVLQNENWYESMPLGTNITITGIGRQAAYVSENHILKLCEQGRRTAQIMGVDKPLVWFDGARYYAYFNDLSANHSAPLDPNGMDVYTNFYHTEYFYWTPDFPEIVVKQAQELKKSYEALPTGRALAYQARNIHIGKFKDFLHPIIYPNSVNQSIEFQTEKPSSGVVRPMDNWFWGSSNEKIQANYLATIKYLGANIRPEDLIGRDIKNGLEANLSKMYPL